MDHKDYRLAAIMFTDIVGFSKMMEEDETGTIRLMAFHSELVKGHTAGYKGSIIKTIGDAFLVDFPNTVNAVKCAIDIQNDLSKYNKENPGKTLVLRIGIHLGDIYFYESDALGEGINIASRLQSYCSPGRVCISQDVYNLVANKIEGLGIRELGGIKLKNISRQIRAYEIMTEGSGKPEPEEAKPKKAEAPRREESSQDPQQPKNPGLDSSGRVDVHALKSAVLVEIKRLGRRINIDQVRGWYKGQIPEGLDEALEALAERGFITRGHYSGGSAGDPPFAAGGRVGDSADGPAAGSGQAYRPSGTRQDGRQTYRSSNESFENGLKEIKEFGKELVQAFKSEFGRNKGGSELSIPRRRSDGSNDNRDKEVERQWDMVLGSNGRLVQDEQLIIQEYRQQTEKSLKKYQRGLQGHLGSYIGVNLFLFILSMTTGPFPWFLFPLGGWGIGMLSHVGTVKRRERELAEIKSLPGLNRGQLRSLRKLHKGREAWGGHAIGTLTTAAFLFMINMITSPWVPWSLIPIAAMGVGLSTHFPVFRSKQREILADLRDQGVPIGLLTSRKERKKLLGSMSHLPDNASPIEMEAARLKGAIEAQLANFGEQKPLGEDFPQLLEDYMKQISELSRKVVEIDHLVKDIPRENLERDLANLRLQLDKTNNKSLAAEYKKGIDQLERQMKAIEDLESQQKIIELRLSNAMNSLRQIQLELVRMKSVGKQELPMQEMKERTEQLNSYVEALREGYSALESDDFKELEKYRDGI